LPGAVVVRTVVSFQPGWSRDLSGYPRLPFSFSLRAPATSLSAKSAKRKTFTAQRLTEAARSDKQVRKERA
jgi:hypothetical protein